MKRNILLAALLTTTLLLGPGFAQTPAGKDEDTVIALARDVQAQQAQIAANQARIDSKLVEVAEAVRVARIFAGRSGQ